MYCSILGCTVVYCSVLWNFPTRFTQISCHCISYPPPHTLPPHPPFPHMPSNPPSPHIHNIIDSELVLICPQSRSSHPTSFPPPHPTYRHFLPASSETSPVRRRTLCNISLPGSSAIFVLCSFSLPPQRCSPIRHSESEQHFIAKPTLLKANRQTE